MAVEPLDVLNGVGAFSETGGYEVEEASFGFVSALKGLGAMAAMGG